jgi:hypothetical protein
VTFYWSDVKSVRTQIYLFLERMTNVVESEEKSFLIDFRMVGVQQLRDIEQTRTVSSERRFVRRMCSSNIII